MPNSPAHIPEKKATRYRSHGISRRSGRTGRSRRVAISSPRNTTTPPKTVLMIQGREKRSSQVPGTTPATIASSRGRMARQRKLFRFCQVIRPLMTRSGSRLPGVIRVLSSRMASSGAEIRGFPNPMSHLRVYAANWTRKINRIMLPV